MSTSEARKSMVDDIQNNVSFSYDEWSPEIEVWMAGEGHGRILPYVAIDFITTQDKKFASFGDIVGRIDDLRYEYAYCELELITVTIYAKKYHNNKKIRGLDYANAIIKRTRKRILAYWNDDILFDYNASIDRGNPAPIRDLTGFDTNTATRIHELELSVVLRTDVRWNKELPPGQDSDIKAEKLTFSLDSMTNIRINTS